MTGPFKILPLLLVAACTTAPRGIPPEKGKLYWPMGIAVDPAGDYAYAVSTNFDGDKTGGTVVVLSLADGRIEADSTIQVGSFAGQFAIASKGDLTMGYVAVREDGMVEFFTITRDEDGTPVLDCGDDTEVGGPPRCDTVHAVLPIGSPKELVGLDRDPFALAVVEDPDGSPSRLVVGSIRDGTLSAMPLGGDLVPRPGAAVQLEAGLHSICEGPVVDGKRRVFVSNRMFNAIHVVDLDTAKDTPPMVRDSIQVAQMTSSGDYFRGLAVTRDGRTLVAVYRSPPSLVVIDLDEQGGFHLRGLVGLAGSPSEVVLAGPRGTLAYVTDYLGDSVYCVDIEAMAVMDRIRVGYGPYGIATAQDPGSGIALVTLFEADSVAVLDTGPSSEHFNEVVGRFE